MAWPSSTCSKSNGQLMNISFTKNIMDSQQRLESIATSLRGWATNFDPVNGMNCVMFTVTCSVCAFSPKLMTSASKRCHTYYLSGTTNVLQIPLNMPTLEINFRTVLVSGDCKLCSLPHDQRCSHGKPQFQPLQLSVVHQSYDTIHKGAILSRQKILSWQGF